MLIFVYRRSSFSRSSNVHPTAPQESQGDPSIGIASDEIEARVANVDEPVLVQELLVQAFLQ